MLDEDDFDGGPLEAFEDFSEVLDLILSHHSLDLLLLLFAFEHFSALQQLHLLPMVAEPAVSNREIVQRYSDNHMIRAVLPLHDGQRALQQLLLLPMLAEVAVSICEIIQIYSDINR